MKHDPQQQRHSVGVDEPGGAGSDEEFELSGRWIRVSLADFDHIGISGTPEGMLGSADGHAMCGSIGGKTAVRLRRRSTALLVTPLVLALVAWAWHPDSRTGPRAPVAPKPMVWLRYDTSVLEADHGARLQRQWHEQLAPVLAHARRPQIMRVRVVAFDEDLDNYEVRLELADGELTWSLPTIRCEACSEARLVALVVESARPWVTP